MSLWRLASSAVIPGTEMALSQDRKEQASPHSCGVLGGCTPDMHCVLTL